MFKRLLSNNRLFAGIVCFLVFIAAGLLYLNHVKSQARRDIQRTQEIVEEWNARRNPQTQTEAGGHSHPDGTFHAGPHESHAPPTAPVETDAPRRVAVSPGAPAVSKDVPPHVSTTPEAASGRTLDPQTQLKIDTLYAEVDRLSAESTVWSNKLYAESQELLKENEAIKAEINKRREMRRDPSVDKETYKAFDAALDARVRAANAEARRLNDLYLENRERHEEYMRLIKEARALGGTR